MPQAQQELLAGLESVQKPGRGDGEASDDKNKHAFWDTQPVPKLGEDTSGLEPTAMGPIDPPDMAAVRTEPYNLPASFEWSDVHLNDEDQAKELYTLLHENYVEDGDNMFRFDYSIEFLRWALQPPGSLNEWLVGVRVTQTRKLVAFISCTPAELSAHGTRVNPHHTAAAAPAAAEYTKNYDEGGGSADALPDVASLSVADLPPPPPAAPTASGTAAGEGADEEPGLVEVNFLCVHKKLRSKRLAPVLIKEITRRVNRRGLFQAAYTAGVVLPKPIARCRYWHRSLNPKKLIEVGFSRLAPRMTMARTVKLYSLPDQPQTQGLRPLREADCEPCCAKLNTFLSKFAIAPKFTVAEFRHWILTQPGVVYSYVVEEPGTKDITDMISFYSLPSSILGNDKHRKLCAAYSYYYFSTKTPLCTLMNDALILAKRLEFDVFNALDILKNDEYLKELKFGIGDGNLQYYLYNWRAAQVAPGQVGLVLL